MTPGHPVMTPRGPAGRWAAPWFAPMRDTLEALDDDLRGGRWDRCVEGLNARARSQGIVNDNGRPLRFVEGGAAGPDAYEAHIWATGGVPTRTGEAGGWHDLFNAATWLAFPRTKARLNRLQAEVISREGIGAGRGGLRDAATLFDENAALFVTSDAAAIDALRGFDWPALFLRDRATFSSRVRVLAFGHALVDKLRAPYKAVCAHAWVLSVPAGEADDLARLDAIAATSIDVTTLRSAAFSPLPVLGIPGWWAENADPAFYDDVAVFRPGRRATRGARPAKAPASQGQRTP